MKNTLIDLNGYLFEQMERLNDEEMTQEDLEKEIKRADSITKISTQIISNADLVFKAEKFKSDWGFESDSETTRMLTGE